MTALKILTFLSAVWAVVALVAQVLTAWGGGRKDFSKPAGNPRKGMAYNLTVAMLPVHKETARRHPIGLVIGAVMHLGVLASLANILMLLAWPRVGMTTLLVCRPLAALALLAGVYLLLRRVVSRTLRAMSAPDDYIAVIMVCGLLALASLDAGVAPIRVALLIHATLLLAYLPLGKLKHAAFFFAARANFGRRLGWRGVVPPGPAGKG